MLLAWHVIPNSVHFFWCYLVHCDHPAVPAQAVGHFPVVEATVLEGVNAQLPKTESNIHVFKMEESGMKGGFVNQFCYISWKNVASAWTEGWVIAVGVQISGHVPLAANISYWSSVYNVASEVPSPRLGVGFEQLINKIIHIYKNITVCLHNVLSFWTKCCYPPHPH